MIKIKTAEEIELMRKAGIVVRDVLNLVGENIKPGITTKQLDTIAYNYITKCSATPSFLGYGGFPGSICASIDEEVVHGIPKENRVLEEGQIISIDAGAILNGWQGDAARTFAVGNISAEKQRLIDVTRESFFKGVEQFKDKNRLGDISHAIQTHAEGNGYSVVRDLVGHGIGTEMHEDPNVPNFGKAGRGVRLTPGMVLAIEPMIAMGTYEVYCLRDNWTVKTQDHMPCGHYENTVALTENGIEILTL